MLDRFKGGEGGNRGNFKNGNVVCRKQSYGCRFAMEQALACQVGNYDGYRLRASNQHVSIHAGETHMYLCKWVGLPYADCTWETAESLSDFQSKIDQFLDREASQYLPKCGPKRYFG
jgi:hypothetical protein